MPRERVINPDSHEPDAQAGGRAVEDPTLAAERFATFVGHSRVVQHLRVLILAARGRGEPLPHTLLIGRSGLRQDLLANVIASEMGANIHRLPTDAIRRVADLVGVLSKLDSGDILYCDDIARVPSEIRDTFRAATSDFKVDISLDGGMHARAVTIPVKPFTLVASIHPLALPRWRLLDLFGVRLELADFAIDELSEILHRVASHKGFAVSDEAASLIATAAAGLPEDAKLLLRRSLDYAVVDGSARVEARHVNGALPFALSSDPDRPTRSQREHISIEVRREVWRRDQGMCVQCGSRERLEFDHVIPVNRGGSHTARNVQLLCERCNRAKSDAI